MRLVAVATAEEMVVMAAEMAAELVIVMVASSCSQLMLFRPALVRLSLKQASRRAPPTRIQPGRPARRWRPNAMGELVSSVVLMGGHWAGSGRKCNPMIFLF
jgi:hypothetical protein